MPPVRPGARLCNFAQSLTCDPRTIGGRVPLSGGPLIGGRAGTPFALQIGVQGFCTMQGINQAPRFDLVNVPAYGFKCPTPALLTTSMTGR